MPRGEQVQPSKSKGKVVVREGSGVECMMDLGDCLSACFKHCQAQRAEASSTSE